LVEFKPDDVESACINGVRACVLLECVYVRYWSVLGSMYRNIKKWSTNPSINPVRLTQAVNVSPRVDINQPNGLNARRVQKCKAEGALHFGVPTIIWHHQKWATEEEMGNRRRDGQQKKRWATEEEMGNRRRDGQQKKRWATEEEMGNRRRNGQQKKKWATEEEMGNRRRHGQQKKKWATEEEMGNRRRDGQQKKRWATEEEMGNRRRDGQQKKTWATEEEMGNRRRDGQQKKKWATEEEYKPQTVINPDRQRRFPHRWYRAPLLNKTSIEQDVIS